MVYMYHSFLVHSSADGHVCHSQDMAPLLTAHCFLVLGTIPLSGWAIHLLKDIVVSSELGAIMNKAVITSSCICVQVFCVHKFLTLE